MGDPKVVSDILGLGAAAEKGLDIAAKFADRLFGPALDQAGLALADPVETWRERRRKRTAETIETAAALCQHHGLTATAVPGRILWPILESASLEEDGDLRAHWASLLARAASEEYRPEILPGYADILRQLTPQQAAILRWMYYDKRELIPETCGFRLPEVLREEIEDVFKLAGGHYDVLAADLHRLQLIDGGRYVTTRYGGSLSSATLYDRISLTALGVALLNACGPLPDPNDPKD